MKPSVKEWLDFAGVDLLAAERLCSDEKLTRVVCFHCQQCVEKSLKAFLESKDIIPPKTHDLIRIYGMLEGQLDIEEDMLAGLNELYIDSRYPAAFGLLPQGIPAIEDARKFYEFSRELYMRIISHLKK
jgi:HEPN domain-containing protein